MFRFRSPGLFIIGGLLAIAPALAQEETLYRSELTVQALGSFTDRTVDHGISQNATNSGGVLANYRFLFNKYNGVEVNYGYSQNTEEYSWKTVRTGVNAFSNEATAAYVLQRPVHRVTPFVEAGAGALVFDPNHTSFASVQARTGFVYGAGADINFSGHFFLRGQYRGLVYDSPGFGLPGIDDRVTHRAEPSLGFGFRN